MWPIWSTSAPRYAAFIVLTRKGGPQIHERRCTLGLFDIWTINENDPFTDDVPTDFACLCEIIKGIQTVSGSILPISLRPKPGIMVTKRNHLKMDGPISG